MENEIYQKAAQEYGTPCYIFDLDTFRNRITAVRNLLGNVADVCFAMKANPFLAGAAAEAAGCLEVCSPGEFHICEKMGVPPEKVVLSGVSKEERDIAYVVEKYGDRPVYTVESMLHLKRLSRAARRNHTRLRVLLRVTSGNQFGLDEKLVKEIVASREDYSEIEFLGLQYFSGTQKKRIKVLRTRSWNLVRACTWNTFPGRGRMTACR